MSYNRYWYFAIIATKLSTPYSKKNNKRKNKKQKYNNLIQLKN